MLHKLEADVIWLPQELVDVFPQLHQLVPVLLQLFKGRPVGFIAAAAGYLELQLLHCEVVAYETGDNRAVLGPE
jgi:hypothetical protein